MGFTWDLWDETNIFAYFKMDAWNTILSYWGFGLFSGAFDVSFREGTIPETNMGEIIQHICLIN